MTDAPIYLDAHATTPVDSRVLEVMLPYFTEEFGNAASKTHLHGNRAHLAVEDARGKIARAIGAKAEEIIFTSGATEAINIAIKGAALASDSERRHFITVATEHPAVLDCFGWLQANGYDVTVLGVDHRGVLDLDALREAIRPDTAFVCAMAANNEIGVIHPLADIGAICEEGGVMFMTDATQALGKLQLDVKQMGIHLLCCSAHKIYGPKGVGALYVRRSNPYVELSPIVHGGGHERGLRSGTINVPGAVGFGKAVSISLRGMAKEQARVAALRDKLQAALLTNMPGASVNGDEQHRLAGNLNICLPGISSDALIASVKQRVSISTGSACTSAEVKPSHVLKAIGLSNQETECSVRIGIGRHNTPEELGIAAELLATEAARLQALASPV